MSTRVTPADFEALVRANPDAVVEIDRAAYRYFLRTASRVTVWTPIPDVDAEIATACASDPSHGRAS
jgi:hypothetical protein